MTDRLAIVTGVSSGIGAATARALLDAGWTVAGLSRSGGDFDSPRYHDLRVDLADLDALTGVVDADLAPIVEGRAWERVGLVNNAGVAGPLGLMEETDPEDLVRSFAVNVVAPIWLMGFVVRTAPAGAALRIVNLESGAAYRAFPAMANYCASKAALDMAGRVLAAELATEARPDGPRPDAAVLSYSPGVVDTPMQAEARSGEGPWNQPFLEFQASGMLVPPEAPAAEIVEFLSGDASERFVLCRFGEEPEGD